MTFLTLTAPGEGGAPRLVRAVVAPERALMLISLVADIPGRGEVELIDGPASLDEAAGRLADKTTDFPGNTAFAFGGAILAPFANRVSGHVEDGLVHTQVAGHDVAIPANGWQGRYAIHGLILDAAAGELAVQDHRVVGLARLDRPDQWPSILAFEIGWTLTAQSLELTVRARNEGDAATPVGIGWHPWFTVPSGQREQVRLHVPARARAWVDNYQSVMPTGALVDVAGTSHDFTPRDGRPLGDLYLDDCYVDLERGPGGLVCAMHDPAFGVGVKLTSQARTVRAVQTYAPPDRPVVVMEPQTNLADPFGAVWGGRETGMVTLQPGETTAYDAAIQLWSP